jgi:hypothetical protein
MRRFQRAATVQRMALILVFFGVIGTVSWLIYLAWSYSPAR